MAKEKKNPKKKKHKVFWFFIKLQIVLMLVVLGCFGYYYFGGYAAQVQELQEAAAKKVANSDEKIFVPSQTSTIYDADGNILTELRGDKNSDYVRIEDIPSTFVVAMVSTEDKKFYSHNGINLKGILRAAKAMLQNGEPTQGGSTITMQLAKLTFLESKKTWQYKIEQMFLARELEKRYNKNKIMEFYLNNIYFANNYYGIQAACKGYFNCDLKDLSLSQCAFLCAIPNSPTYYDPVTNMEHTLQRRDRILQGMLDDGKISPMQYTKAANETITLNRPKKVTAQKHNYVDTFVYYCATRALMKKEGFKFQYEFDSEEEEKTYDDEYDQLYTECQKKIYTGGYKIYTSIKMNLQKELQSAVDDGLKGFSGKSKEGVYKTQGAAVCIDNETGLVAAIVGGRSQDFNSYTLNRAYQSHRQPGSSIKPLIVYTPSFENGYTPDSPVVDQKIKDGPSNSNGSFIGKTNLRTAVARSINTVAWQLFEELGPKKGISYLKKMNFSKLDPKDETMATSLGGFTKGVSPLEMASAYAALENDGVYRTPTCIESIIDSDDNIAYDSEEEGVKVYEKNAARTMTDVMTSVMQESYGTGHKVCLSDMPCAGKTGTTNSHKDGWFVGFTRYYTTSVWVGNDIPKEIDDLSGATYPGGIWHDFMEKIHKELPVMEFLPSIQLSDEFRESQNRSDEEQEKPKENKPSNNNKRKKKRQEDLGTQEEKPKVVDQNGDQENEGTGDIKLTVDEDEKPKNNDQKEKPKDEQQSQGAETDPQNPGQQNPGQQNPGSGEGEQE